MIMILGSIISIDKGWSKADSFKPMVKRSPLIPLGKALLLTSFAALAACARVPDMAAPAIPLSPDQAETARSFSAPQGLFPADRWWAEFGDPTLTSLMDEALAKSPSVAMAAARVRAADALTQLADSATKIQIGLDASAGGQRMSQNQSFPPAFIPNAVQSTGRLAASVSFDPDIWGRNRAALQAASSEAAAAKVDEAQARLMLSTSIAATWADFARLYEERDVAEEAVRIRAATEKLVGQRVQHGLDNQGDLGLARSRAAAARGDVKGLDEAIALTRNALAELAGAGPDRGLLIQRPAGSVALALSLPEKLALNLLGRRPDIVAARLRGEAASARVAVAKAEFYPDISLSAVAGLQSIGLEQLLKPSSIFTSFGPALRLPVFTGGALEANYRQNRAALDGAIAHYDATLLAALHEVADAITRKKALGPRLADAQAALAAARQSQRVAQLRYRNGLSNLLQVLATEDATIGAERAVTALSASEHQIDILLIRALGGGFLETAQ